MVGNSSVWLSQNHNPPPRCVDGRNRNGVLVFLAKAVRNIQLRRRIKIVSMGLEAYNKKKWRGLNSLQSALSMTQLDDHHYGYSSAHYNKFASLSDLLEISLLVLDNVDKIPYSGDLETFKDAEWPCH